MLCGKYQLVIFAKNSLPMSKKCILLVRVSTTQQDLNQQREVVYKEALRDGYKVSDIIIIEDKESGSRLSEEERNGLNRMYAEINNCSDINAVYVYEISRISRRAAVVYSVRDFLIKHNIQLVVITPFCRLLNPDGTVSETSNVMFGIFASLAENETMIRKARTERGIHRLISEGKHGRSRPLFGYAVNKEKYYIEHPENAEIVRTIFRLYLKGVSIRKISIELHERNIFGHVTFSDLMQRVWKILKEERYAGDGRFPALITRKQFDDAALIRQVKKREYSINNVYLCKRMLKDSETMQTLSPRIGIKRYATININRDKNFKQISVRMDLMDDLLLSKAIELHKKYGHQISDVNEYKHDIEVLRVKIDTCKAVINKMKESIERTEERYIIGAITKDKAETLERGFIERIQENEKNIIICKNKIEYIEGLMQQVIDNYSFDYERLSNEDKVKLIRTTINYATVQRGVNRNATIVEIFNNYNEETEKVIIFSGRKVK